MTKHKHEWTALWSHWGPYGPQDEHFHECMKCGMLLVGPGRTCKRKSPHEETRGVNKKRTAVSEV